MASKKEEVGNAAKAMVEKAKETIGGMVGAQDPLYERLHEQHQEVDQLLERILSTDDGRKADELWRTCAVALAVHARAEQESVYDALERDQEEKILHAREEHEDIEDLLADADAARPGTDEFYGLVAELQTMVRHHVNEEEGQILPKARKSLNAEEREELVEMFDQRSEQLRPQVELEFSGASADLRDAGESRRAARRRARGRAA